MMSKRNFIWGSKKNSQRFKGPEVDSGVLTYRLHRNIRGRVDVQQFEGAGLRPGRRRQKREGMVRGTERVRFQNAIIKVRMTAYAEGVGGGVDKVTRIAEMLADRDGETQH